jgi:hypothetical protein
MAFAVGFIGTAVLILIILATISIVNRKRGGKDYLIEIEEFTTQEGYSFLSADYKEPMGLIFRPSTWHRVDRVNFTNMTENEVLQLRRELRLRAEAKIAKLIKQEKMKKFAFKVSRETGESYDFKEK